MGDVMRDGMTRRDFLNGAALTIAAGLAPIDQVRAGSGFGDYPPERSGLRGSHDGAFEVAHALRDGKAYPIDHLAAQEHYDLLVVGAGLAGLSAAWFYKRAHPKARILILDNHDDFGGHAKRNEFEVNGRMILGYGGSESMASPRTEYGADAKKMLRALGVDPERFYDERVFHRKLYPGLGLSRGIFFNKEAFGVDTLVAGDPLVIGFDEFAPDVPNARAMADVLDASPLSAAAKVGLKALFAGSKDPMHSLSKAEKKAALEKISYRVFLEKTCGLPKDAADFFQGRLNDNFGLGIDCISAFAAMEGGLPGAKSLGIEDAFESHGDEPYIHHFPDGNASIARLIVQSLIPNVTPKATKRGMEHIVTARFDYSALDQPGNDVRIRLNSTATILRNEKGRVTAGYVCKGITHRISARRAIVATYSVIARHIVPEMPDAQKSVMANCVKAPLLYTKVIIKNWQSFIKLGVHAISAPMSYHSLVKLDYPVSLGAYRCPRDPNEPIGLHLVHVPLEPNSGLTAHEQCRAGRARLLQTPFEAIEREIRSDLDRMLGPGAFSAKDDILAITVNRWSHGYAYSWNSLYDDVAAGEASMDLGRRAVGAIAFANSDTGFDAYAHTAIAEAARAAKEIG
jgi:spermidine dehydrogenase